MDKLNIDIIKKKEKHSFLFLKDKVHNQVTSLFYKTESTLFMINSGSSMFRYLIKYEIFNDVKKVKIILTNKDILYTSSLIDIIDYLIKEKQFKKNQIILFCHKNMDITPLLDFYNINKELLIIWHINKEIKITDSNIYIRFVEIETFHFLLISVRGKKYIICFDFIDINKFIQSLIHNEITFDELLVHYFSIETINLENFDEIYLNKLYLNIPKEFKSKISFLTIPNYIGSFHSFKLKAEGFKIIKNTND